MLSIKSNSRVKRAFLYIAYCICTVIILISAFLLFKRYIGSEISTLSIVIVVIIPLIIVRVIYFYICWKLYKPEVKLSKRNLKLATKSYVGAKDALNSIYNNAYLFNEEDFINYATDCYKQYRTNSLEDVKDLFTEQCYKRFSIKRPSVTNVYEKYFSKYSLDVINVLKTKIIRYDNHIENESITIILDTEELFKANKKDTTPKEQLYNTSIIVKFTRQIDLDTVNPWKIDDILDCSVDLNTETLHTLYKPGSYLITG